MSKIITHLLSGLLRLFASLPSRVLYVLSDVIALKLYYLFRYRRKVVRKNLINSFPHHSLKEICQIERAFYFHLADVMMETIQQLNFKSTTLKQHYIIKNKVVLEELLSKNKSVLVAFSHSNNWELLAQVLGYEFNVPTYALYKQPSSPIFDRLMIEVRTRSGLIRLLESQSAYRKLAGIKETQKIVFLLGDQTPPGLETDHWTTFLHQETPFFNGIEKMARSFDHGVVFIASKKIRRGFYSFEVIKMTENPRQTLPGEITEQYARLLENTIMQQPQTWLWSHRRWKHQRNKKA
jgi:KDO2-lipid IV(A) lauroyltransferase